MATQKSPLVGYNHNLKYKGRVYHVQTEDSGLENPHVITHLFHDGTILSTVKQEYHDLVGDPDWERQLRLRMQNQHKDMMKGLIRGQLDDRIREFFGTVEAEVEEEAPMTTLPPPGPVGGSEPAAPPPPPAPWDPSKTPRRPAAAPAAPPPAAQVPPSGGGVVVAMPMVIVGEQQPPQGASSSAPAPLAASGAAPPPTSGQPAAPKGEYRPAESRPVPDSIFGSDILSEKSLDEVILAYLSEDMADD